jgi:hypothetical protein
MAVSSIKVDIPDGPKKGTEVLVNVEDFSLADDEDLISVVNPKNSSDTAYLKKKEVIINPNALKPSKENKTDSDKKSDTEDKEKSDDDILAGLGL